MEDPGDVITRGGIEVDQLGEGCPLDVTQGAVVPLGGHGFAGHIGEGITKLGGQFLGLRSEYAFQLFSCLDVEGPAVAFLDGHDAGTVVLHLDRTGKGFGLGLEAFPEKACDFHVANAVILHLLGPGGPVGVILVVAFVVVKAPSPGFQAMTAVELRRHSLLADLVVDPQDVREELTGEDQSVAEFDLLGCKPGKHLVEHLNVVADDVVANQKVSLSQVAQARGDGLVGAVVIVNIHVPTI